MRIIKCLCVMLSFILSIISYSTFTFTFIMCLPMFIYQYLFQKDKDNDKKDKDKKDIVIKKAPPPIPYTQKYDLTNYSNEWDEITQCALLVEFIKQFNAIIEPIKHQIDAIMKEMKKMEEGIDDECDELWNQLDKHLAILNKSITDSLKQNTETAKELALAKILTDKGVANMFVMDFTPNGNVIMTYSIQHMSFLYYCDHSVSFPVLETVARKFVKQFHCFPLYTDMKNEITRLKEEKEERERKKRASASASIPVKKNVFAQFKSTNVSKSRANTIKDNRYGMVPTEPIKMRTNKFSNGGVFSNFKFLKTVKMPIKKQSVSFADYKKMQNMENMG